MTLEAAELAVIKSGLDSLVDEMSINLRRSAFSSIVRESRDFSVALLDARGEVVAQAECIPIMTAGIALAFKGVADTIDLDLLAPGDAILMNDPFLGGQHLQDIYLFTPIFSNGHVIGFGASTAHHVDLGGAHAGLSAQATEIYQEGLRLPGVLFSIERDFRSGHGSIRRLIEANVRVPDAVVGDLEAQLAAARTAEVRLGELTVQHGLATCIEAMEALKDYSERRVRQAISRLPDGVYTATESYEASAWGIENVEVKVKVTIAGDEIVVDFEGTAPQLLGNTNCPYASTVSAVQSAIRCIIDDPDIDFNEGCNRPLTVRAPYGSVLNPKAPAAVRSRLTPAARAFNGVVRSLAEVSPGAAVATGYDTSTAVAVSHLGETGYHVVIELVGGGWGACADHDGASGLDNPISNCANAPVEALEVDNDHFVIVEYSLVDGSEGRGEHSGGLGVRRVYEATVDGVKIAGYADRHMKGASGLAGGGDAAPGSFTIQRRSGELEKLPTVYSAGLNTGDRLIVETGGGGGYGKSAE